MAGYLQKLNAMTEPFRLRVLVIFLAALWLLPSRAEAKVVVIVRQEAEAAGNYVRICDVARVEGPNDQAVEVANTVLGPTPPKGETREFSRWEIELRLAEMGLDAIVSFSGNEAVRVFGNGAKSRRSGDAYELGELASMDIGALPGGGSARDLPAKEIVDGVPALAAALAPKPAEGKTAAPEKTLAGMDEEARARVAQAIREYLESRYSRKDVEIEARLLSITAPVPVDAADIRVTDALEGKVPGKAVLALVFKEAAGGTDKRVVVSADTEIAAMAPVAARPLFKGDILNRRDIAIARVKMKSGVAYLMPNVKALEGREVRRELKPGEPILAADAPPADAVKRGTLVELDTRIPGFRVQATVKALGSGNIGDLIMVEDQTNKNNRYQVRITGHNTVAVPYGRGK